jgi:hypothetical protein
LFGGAWLVSCTRAPEPVQRDAASQSGARRMVNDKPMPLSQSETYRHCQTAADCVAVTNGCCDCANGGSDIAINRQQQEAFRAQFKCSPMCTMVGAVPPCLSGEVSCEANLCSYRAPKYDFPQ